MAGVNPEKNFPVPEAQENRERTPDSPAESSATGRNQRPHPSALQGDPWSPESIQLPSPKIQAMREAGKRLRVIYRTIANRLCKEGVQRSWVQCREMMLDLEDLYFTIQEANQKRQGEPLPCPFYEGLIRVLPFTHTWEEGPQHEVPDAEPTGYDPSGAYFWNPLPVWTFSWLPQMISTDQWVNRETDDKSPQEPPQAIPWTPITFNYKPNHVINGHSPQGIPQGTPWTSRPFTSSSNHITLEQAFQTPAQLIPLQLHSTIPYIQHQGPIENNPQFQPQDFPSSIPTSATMKHKGADQYISQDRPQGIPLISKDHKEPVTDSSQGPTPLIAQTVPTLNSRQNEETADTTTQGHTPQEISYSSHSSTQTQVNYEYHLTNPGLMCPSPLPYPHAPPQFSPLPLYSSPHLYIHT